MKTTKNNRLCTIQNCGNKHYAKNYCFKHYQRLNDDRELMTWKERFIIENPPRDGIGLIPLTQSKQAIVDEDNYCNLIKYNWHYTNYGYAARRDNKNNKMVLMHRYILNTSENEIYDHKNRNPLDNRKCNLRKCDRSQNGANSKQRSSKSGYRGVSQHVSGLWHARTNYKRKEISIGYFKSKEDAARARDKIARKIFGEFAVLNFPCES